MRDAPQLHKSNTAIHLQVLSQINEPGNKGTVLLY